MSNPSYPFSQKDKIRNERMQSAVRRLKREQDQLKDLEREFGSFLKGKHTKH